MTLAVMGVSFVAQIWIGRHLGPAGLGEYNAVSLFVSVLSVVGCLGLPFAILRAVASAEEREADLRPITGAVAWLTLAFAAIVALVGMASWPAFATLARLDHELDHTVAGLAAGAMVIQYGVINLLLARLRFLAVTLIAVAQPLAVLVTGPAGVANSGAEMAIAGVVGTTVVAAGWWLNLRLWPRFDAHAVRDLLAGSTRGIGVLHVTLLTGWIDRAVAALVLGPIGLGAFASASHLTEAALRLARGAGQFGIAAYARLAADPVAVARVHQSHLRILASALLVVSGVLVASGRTLVPLLFGPGFVPGTTTLQALAIALLPVGLTYALTSRGVGTHDVRSSGPFAALFLLLQLVASLTGALILSIAGIALAHLAVWTLGLGLNLRLDRQRTVPPSLVTRIAVGAIGVLGVEVVVGRLPLPFIIQVGVGAGLPLVVALLFFLEQPERRVLRRIVRD